MINLIGHKYRAELAAAKRNVILRKYVSTLILLIVGIAACYGVGYMMLDIQQREYEKQIATYAPQREWFNATVDDARVFNKNLAVAKSILSNEVIYSYLVLTITSQLPPGAVLANLSLRTKDLAQPIPLTIVAKTPNDAVATKNAFDQSTVFKDTKLKTVDKTLNDEYPYTAVLITTIDMELYLKRQGAIQ